MLNIDYNKLQDALEEIKSVCELAQENDGCCGCPLGNKYGTCQIGTIPQNWCPRNPETHAFRCLE